MAKNYRELGRPFQGEYTGVQKMNEYAESLHRAGELPERFPESRQRLNAEAQAGVGSRIEAFTPEALTAELERIAGRYQELEFHRHKNLKISSGQLKDSIMALVTAQPERSRNRFDIPAVGFGQIPPKDQCEMAGINYYLDDFSVSDWKDDPKGYETPDKTYLTWMQDGKENLGRSVKKVRSSLAQDKRGATIYDGLGLHIAYPQVLKDHYVDLPGTVVGSGSALTLSLWGGGPRLGYRLVGVPVPRFGSASCGRE